MAPLKQFVVGQTLDSERLFELFEIGQAAKDDLSLQTIFKIQCRTVESIYTSFTANHLQVLQNSSHEQFADYVALRKKVDRAYFSILALIDELFPPQEVKAAPSSPVDPANTTATSNVKLPIIQLPVFMGDPHSWQGFIDLFTSLVHNANISNCEKFQYLIMSLRDEPLHLIKSIPMTSENYQQAYDTLKERYSNKRFLATHHWTIMKNFAPIISENPKALRQLVDTFSENLQILKTLGFVVDSWDFILVDLVLGKLDSATRKRFELHFNSSEIPTYDILKRFLDQQCIALDNVTHFDYSSTPSTKVKPLVQHSSLRFVKGEPKAKSFLAQTSQQQGPPCPMCKSSHYLMSCPGFLALQPPERYDKARQLRLCINCLRTDHSLRTCHSKNVCRFCKSPHHSLLHFDTKVTSSNIPKTSSNNSSATSNEAVAGPSSSLHVCTGTLVCGHPQAPLVLLSTIKLKVCDRQNHVHTLRALIDSGSQASFITDACSRAIGFSRRHSDLPISGIGHTTHRSKGVISCDIFPIHLASRIDSRWGHLEHIRLADAEWNVPGPINMLLGADIFSRILMDGKIVGPENTPVAINTKFGYMIAGTVDSSVPPSSQSLFASYGPCPDADIKRFWEIEEIPSKKWSSPEDSHAEEIFGKSHFRLPSGRFGVTLPFKQPTPSFPNSRAIAVKRLLPLERRLDHNPDLRASYLSFMEDYASSGHMSLLSSPPEGDRCYYIPHHAVTKFENGKNKIRVVFDASAPASNSLSLNDTLLIGPKLQSDILKILLNFRIFAVAFVCDIRQMYRQILVDPQDCRYQLIQWRSSPTEPISTYQLNTITYGVSSAPFLAIRTLLELAKLGKQEFPLAAHAIENNLYVDDFLCGSPSLPDAFKLRHQLVQLLKSGCLELRKWASNSPTLLDDIPPDHIQAQPHSYIGECSPTIKVLGLQWHSSSDRFEFEIASLPMECTKRILLSAVARIYDPLGFLTPVTFALKQLVQRFWVLGLDWDDPIPDSLQEIWNNYRLQLNQLNQVKIPRHINIENAVDIQLHAFSDASELGYAAVVYFRIVCRSGEISTAFITSKSKVAPLKFQTIPRLELCAALLSSNLVDFVISTYSNIPLSGIFCYTDSAIVLSWITSHPSRWKVFVANRVSHIHDKVSPEHWRHVCSQENPADLASRGLLPQELIENQLWWAGSHWLSKAPNIWLHPSMPSSLPAEARVEEKNISLLVVVEPHFVETLLEGFSSLRKIQGIIAYCRRLFLVPKSEFISLALSAKELQDALMIAVKVVQTSYFSDQLVALRQGKLLPKQFRKLAPFIDSEGILRVGGRLAHSNLPLQARYPALLPNKHYLSDLIIDQIHQKNLHSGHNTTLYLLQQNFWVLSSRLEIRRVISKCNRCYRINPIPYSPAMGNLPSYRVTEVKPFSSVGVDFAGPITTTPYRIRGSKTVKSYLCIFICMATKALHLEVVSDLSADAFLAALRRFIARRGRCKHIFSDCGTNFVGANRQLISFAHQAAESEAIIWHFNPPSAPHFGGLWESAVKTVKTHLLRVVGDQILSFEELTTLITQIEALLNSRPLCNLSSDPNDATTLTPGHFLTLEPLTSAPDPDLSHLKVSRLSRWQMLQHLHHSFWDRWHREYLHQLHQRSRWFSSKHLNQADIGTLVLIKEDSTPPLQWRLGRIVDLHPGSDGIPRVASVHTLRGVIQRPMVKLCALPSQ